MVEKIIEKSRWWVRVLVDAGRNWLDSQAFIYAAALAFFTAFSIAPVMIVAVAVLGVILGPRAAEAGSGVSSRRACCR